MNENYYKEILSLWIKLLEKWIELINNEQYSKVIKQMKLVIKKTKKEIKD